MKKLLILFSSTLLSFTSTSILNFSKLATKINNNQKSYLAKRLCFKPKTIKKNNYFHEWAYFAIDIINLSYMPIKSINELHNYNVIEIPKLEIKWNNNVILFGDKLNLKTITLKPNNWSLILGNSPDPGIKVTLEHRAKLWYSNDEKLMMRVWYRIWLSYSFKIGFIGGMFTLQTGNVIKIYY